ncbi:MAG: histidine kinase [Bacteroidales bacterium]|nr:histidine kinase [Bacteroidales bacterium]
MFWIILWMQESLTTTLMFDISPLTSAFINGVFIIIMLLFSIILWYPCRFMTFEEFSLFKLITNHFLLAIIISTIASGLHSKLFPIMADSIRWEATVKIIPPLTFVVFGLFYYFIIIAIYYLYMYYENYQIKTINEAKLEKMLKENELKTLRFQINPHFLFNSLNSIAALTLDDGLAAREMIIKLSDFFRMSLKEYPNQKHTLEEELASLKLYLDIETMRFGPKLVYILDCEKNLKNYLLPFMILQPIIENAVKHGVYENTQLTSINLKCSLINNKLKISISNNFEPDSGGGAPGMGLGLKNVEERLNLLYDRQAFLRKNIKNNIYIVECFFPLEIEKDLIDD